MSRVVASRAANQWVTLVGGFCEIVSSSSSFPNAKRAITQKADIERCIWKFCEQLIHKNHIIKTSDSIPRQLFICSDIHDLAYRILNELQIRNRHICTQREREREREIMCLPVFIVPNCFPDCSGHNYNQQLNIYFSWENKCQYCQYFKDTLFCCPLYISPSMSSFQCLTSPVIMSAYHPTWVEEVIALGHCVHHLKWNQTVCICTIHRCMLLAYSKIILWCNGHV